MHADHLHPLRRPCKRHSDTARHPPRGVVLAGNGADKALARGAQQDGQAQIVKQRQTRQQAQVMRQGLAKADTRIDGDMRARNASCHGVIDTRGKRAVTHWQVIDWGSAGIVAGVLIECIKTTGRGAAAAVCAMAGSYCSAVTSFKILAPAAKAACATADLRVSMEMGKSSPPARSAAITGAVRAISSSAATSTAPGRVLAPPMSMISDPAAIRRACIKAAPAAKNSPALGQTGARNLARPVRSRQ